MPRSFFKVQKSNGAGEKYQGAVIDPETELPVFRYLPKSAQSLT